MKQRDNLLCKIKKYIDENLNPKKCNFFDSSKDDYEQATDILDILRELDISKNEYYEGLSISSDDDFQIHFKRLPSSCFVNNYFDEGLLAWQAKFNQCLITTKL